jgi:hypothetical protein
MVCSHSSAGVALGGAPKAEATGLAPLRIGEPSGFGSGVFPLGWKANPGGDALELRLWAYNAEIAGRPARRTK